MALLNPPKKTTKKDSGAKPAQLSPEVQARVDALARGGNTAAQLYISGGGTIAGNTEVTNDSGGSLSASDVIGQVASGNVGGYNVSQRSQTIGQIAAASGYTTPSQISTIGPNLSSTSLVASNPYQGTYNPATVGYRSSMVNNDGELFYKPEDAEKQAEYLQKNKMAPITSTTPVGDQVSIADGIAAQEKARKLLDQYGTMAVTQPEWQESINAMLTAGIENINKQNPTPREPIFTTKAQQDALASDPTGTQKEYYDKLYKELGQGKLQEQRIDTMKQLQAVQEVYQKVIDQIKENPNLPKGLAARRLTEVFEDQKFAASALIAQLEIIDQQIDDNNGEIDRQLGIFEYDKSQEEKAQERRMSQLEMLISSGAIAGMTSAELQQWSAASGMPLTALQKVQNDMMNPEKSYGVEFRDDGAGNLVMITYDKNNPLDRTVEQIGSSKPAGGGTGTAPTITLTADARRSLVDSGFTEQEALQIENDVRTYGLDAAVNQAKQGGATTQQINAIRNSFDEGPKTSSLTRESLAKLYGITDTADRKSFLGFEYGDSGSATLDALMTRVQAYIDAGVSDEKILELIGAIEK